MTRTAALAKLLAAPRDHADQGRIGRRVLYAKADGRERLDYCIKVLKSALRRVA